VGYGGGGFRHGEEESGSTRANESKCSVDWGGALQWYVIAWEMVCLSFGLCYAYRETGFRRVAVARHYRYEET